MLDTAVIFLISKTAILNLLLLQIKGIIMGNTNKETFGKQHNKIEDRRKTVREELAVKEAMDLFDEQFNEIFKNNIQSVIQSAKTIK